MFLIYARSKTFLKFTCMYRQTMMMQSISTRNSDSKSLIPSRTITRTSPHQIATLLPSSSLNSSRKNDSLKLPSILNSWFVVLFHLIYNVAVAIAVVSFLKLYIYESNLLDSISTTRVFCSIYNLNYLFNQNLDKSFVQFNSACTLQHHMLILSSAYIYIESDLQCLRKLIKVDRIKLLQYVQDLIYNQNL